MDKAKKNEADYRWTKKACTRISLKIRNDSGIPDAIEKVRADDISANSYILQALREKLIKDGYFIEPEE